MRILSDPRVRSVPWRDLVALGRWEIFREIALSLPWLLASLAAAQARLYPLALGLSFVFFLAGLRQVHNGYHYALGISKAATEALMFVLSVLMLGSMHAVQVNHLRHHRHCMDDEDIEAWSARMPGWKAICLGPMFPLRLHHKAWQVGDRVQRRWIAAELAANALWIALVFGVLDLRALKYHVLAMAAGQCLTAFFAVWTVHHDCDREHYIARTVRSRFKSWIAFDMFYHVEHHLFPKVPTCRLAIVAERLDRAAPELCSRLVF